MSQELKTPTLEDLIPGGETYRYAENLYSLQWWGDECIKPSIDTLFVIDPKTGKEKIIAIRETVNKVLEKEQTGKLPHFYSTSFPWADKEEMLIELPGKYVVYDFKTTGSFLPLHWQKVLLIKIIVPLPETWPIRSGTICT